jgi:hypothetical protein
MSQTLVPVDGGVQEIQTTTTENRLLVVSQQYITANNLESRPTEWVPGGRPIYRRLPATSETYQIDFFNIVPSPNSAAAYEVQEQGYVYIPWGEGLNSAASMQVVASDSKQDLLIKSGTIVWRYGNTEVLPTIVNLEILDVVSGKYDVAYQLIFDDSPVQKLYQVTDYILTGLPLNITSSTDSVVGWRYPAVNAFLNTSNNWWANQDTFLPSYAQPVTSFIQWESDLPQAYSKVTLRCPDNTAYTGTATLSYYDNSTLVTVSEVSIQKDSTGQFFEFAPNTPVFQSGWNVSFSSLDMAIQGITVSGVLTLLEPQESPSTRATLVMYPTGTLPKTVVNASNETVPATYCSLARVDITNTYKVENIQDLRYIIHRDYVPVADWLTKPFDEDLIDLYEQVTDYRPLWMAPPSAMTQEYAALSKNQITVEV